jgi:hypothetical protein
MWTHQKINDYIKACNFKLPNTSSEVRELPNILSPDEDLHGLLQGNLKSIAGRKQAGIGLGIITSKRIIFFRKSIIGTTTKEEIPLSRISSASFRSGIALGCVAVTSNSNEALIDDCDKKLGAIFAKVVTDLINEYNSKSHQPTTNTLSNYDKIEKLFELKEKGIITDEEFTTQKTALLNSSQ